MAAPVFKMFKGPFKGVEMRDAYQTDQHLEIAINVNLSRGYIEPRPGKHAMSFARDDSRSATVDYMDNIGYIANPRVHLIDRPTSDTWLLVVGPYTSNQLGAGNEQEFIEIQAFNLTTNTRVEFLMNTTLTSQGEPYHREFNCSFVDTFLPGGRAATLICTDNGTYVFTPDMAEDPDNAGNVFLGVDSPTTQTRLRHTSVRYEDTSGFKSGYDASLNHDTMFSYAENAPPGSIAEAHAGMVFYAGFDGQRSLTMQSQIDNDSTGNPQWMKPDSDNIPVTMIDNQYSVRMGRHMFCWSDLGDPLAVNETAFGTVDYGQEITGLKSFNDVLFIFTRRSTFGFVGGIDPKTSKVWKVSSIGCTAPNTPVVAGEKIFWINDNGIWASDGPKTLRISDPIGKLFSDEEDSGYIPRTISDPFLKEHYGLAKAGDFGIAAGLGYPWKIDKKLLHLATAVHNPIHHQIWFNVPVTSSLRFDDDASRWAGYDFQYAKHINALTIVYDYELDAFSFYVDGNFSYRTFCADAVYWPEQNQMIIACVSQITHSDTDDDHHGQFQSTLETFPHHGQDWATPMYAKAWTAAGGGGVSGMNAAFGFAKRTVPYAWCSARLFRDNEEYVDVRRPRITMLASGHRLKRDVLIGGVETKDWAPVWFLETEQAAYEEWKDSTATAGLSDAGGAFSQEGMLQCHPRAYDNIASPDTIALNVAADEVAQPAYFWSGVTSLGSNGDLTLGKWDSGDHEPAADKMVWGSVDWFTQQIYYPEGNLAGKSIRVGVVYPDFWVEDGQGGQGNTYTEHTAPPPVGVVSSFSFEVQRGETTR